MYEYTSLPYNNYQIYVTNEAFYVSSGSNEGSINKDLDKDSNIEEVNVNLNKQEQLEIKEAINNQETCNNKQDKQNGIEIPIKKTSLRIKLNSEAILIDNKSLSNSDLEVTKNTVLPTFSLPTPSPSKMNFIDKFKHKEKYLKIPFDKSGFVETNDVILSEPYKKYKIYGIVGTLKLLTGWHLIIITKVRKVGEIQKRAIYHIESISLLPYDYTLSVLALEEDLNSKINKNETKEDNSGTNTPNLFERLKAVVQNSDKKSEEILINKTELLKVDNNSSNEELTPLSSPGLKSNNWDSQSDNSNLDKDNQNKDDIVNTMLTRKSSKSEDELLELRIKKEIKKLFNIDGNMYFSYDYDVTNNLQSKEEKIKDKPIFFKTFNNEFWWNKTISKELINKELSSFILPIIQGYFQNDICEIDNIKFNLSLLSRRSINRLGMRYQRRGINEFGYVANFVETEQILELNRNNENHICSFLQIRGSIPLFWSQSPYSLRPIPIMERSGSENLDAFIKHIARLNHTYYNKLIMINLSEQSGRESIVSSAFRNYLVSAKQKVKSFESQVQLKEFDFHRECQGMNYENINKLILELENEFNFMDYYWKENNNKNLFTKQKAIFRSNCMDCLDRTNVVQSTLARYILNKQLFRLGIQEYPDLGIKYHEKFENMFNNLWANNGDALSQAYTGTSALKGDFTRYGKRNLQGIMNDATNSLSRFYINAFKDFFTQAVLDYLQGHHKLNKFREVAETHIATEPGLEDRLKKVRLNAIDISSNIVLLDNEVKLKGWTLLSPSKINTIFHTKIEEKIILLTTCNIYICSFHYGLEKVIQFIRIPLENITKIQIGEYYLKANELNMDSFNQPEDNKDAFGMVIFYKWNLKDDKYNNKSLKNTQPSKLIQIINNTKLDNQFLNNNLKSELKFIALKGIPNLLSSNQNESDNENENEDELMKHFNQTNNNNNPNNNLFSGHQLLKFKKFNENTIGSYQVIMEAKEQINLAYWNKISNIQDDIEIGDGLIFEDKSILDYNTLKLNLFPSTTTNLLMSPKLLSDHLVKRLTN